MEGFDAIYKNERCVTSPAWIGCSWVGTICQVKTWVRNCLANFADGGCYIGELCSKELQVAC